MPDFRDALTSITPILSLIGIGLSAYTILLWAASVLWTYRDIHSRTEDVLVQVLAVSLALLLPFAGLILHLILRPRHTLTERYERTLEEQYLRRDIEERFVCPSCQRPIDQDFLLCPHCHTTLRRRCTNSACERVIDLTWTICPYCGDDGSAAPSASYRSAHSTTKELELIER